VKPASSRAFARFFVSQIWATTLVALCLATCLASPDRLNAQQVLDRDAGRALLFQLIGQERIDEAAALAETLLAANPRDHAALVGMSQIERRRGNFRRATQAGQAAWRYAATDGQRHAAAMVTAQALSTEGRRQQAMFWLRRAVAQAPDDATRNRAVTAFGLVRQIAPLSLRFSASVSPSNNINNGARSARVYGGTLSGTSLALSGWETSIQTRARYKLPVGNGAGQSSVDAAWLSKRYRLSEEARAIAPTADNSDYDFDELEFGWERRWPGKTTPRLRFSVGETWSGGERLSRFRNAELHIDHLIGEQTRVGASWIVEDQDRLDVESRGATSHALGLRVAHVDRIDTLWSLQLLEKDTPAESAVTNRRQTILSGRVQLADPPFGKRMAFGIEFEQSDYRIPIIFGKRDDRRWELFSEVTLENASVLGFAPVVSLRIGETESTVDIYDTEIVTLGLGFASEF